MEKAAIKSQLLHYVKAHPVNTDEFPTHLSSSLFSINNFRNKKTLSAFVIGGLLLGSSVSFASERAVPGDILYSVKIHINEQVLDAIAVTPQAKADWGVRKVERRLEEVEKLAVTPSVSREIKIATEENFNASVNKVEERIAIFEKEDDSEEAIRTAEKLAEMLRKHERVSDKKSFDMVVAVSDTPSLEITATTSLESALLAPEVKSVSRGNVLENIRVARGKAEKKQKELKNKYRKESERKNGSLEAGTPNISTENPVIKEVSSQDETSGKNYNKSFNKHNGRKEEIRTTPREDELSTHVPKPNEND
jgi:hypothetical protein